MEEKKNGKTYFQKPKVPINNLEKTIMHLSVIIPIYNEEKSLKANLANFSAYLEKQDYTYELLLINDGSKDKTNKIAEEFCCSKDYAILLNHKTNQGKGAAVKTGMLKAKGKFRIFLDADGATPIEHIDLIWKPFQEGADIVIGSRNYKDAKNAKQIKKQILWKRILGICGNKLIQLLIVRGIYDTQCGFKAFREDTAKKIFPLMQIKRWIFDIEILSIAQKYKYKTVIIPVSWLSSNISRVGLKGYFIALFELIKIKKNLLLKKY